jgi:V/A-type H+-transporting ATPase subunit E
MNGVQNIIDRIDADSAAECAEIAAEAERQCEEIKAEYSKAEQDAYWKIVNEGAKEAEQRIERLGSVAKLEARKQILAAKQELVARAFERAAEKIAQLPTDRYVSFLAELAVKAAVEGTELLIFSREDAARVGKRVCDGANAGLAKMRRTAKLTLSDTPGAFKGGFILTSGEVETNCTAQSLVSQYRNELSAAVAEALFE